MLVKNIAQQAFDNWFRAAEDMEPVHQFMQDTLPPNDSEVVTVFLRLTQALEVFFRRFAHKTYIAKEEYEQYYNAMFGALPATTPDALRERLRNYLRFGNEYSLKSAVQRLIESLKEPALGALNIDNAKKFAQLTANIRNWLTHYGERREPVASGAREYYDINQQLRALLFGVLAQSLGFDVPAVQNCIQAILSRGYSR
ncbi:MAG: HEPN domain-containing protein [Terriglobia bacterium]